MGLEARSRDVPGALPSRVLNGLISEEQKNARPCVAGHFLCSPGTLGPDEASFGLAPLTAPLYSGELPAGLRGSFF
jgi:hypothetical protein